MPPSKITSPDDPALAELCRELAGRAGELDATGAWPAEQLRLCGEYGVYQWFAAPQWGGQGWNEEDVLRGYLALSAACLTTTFILTQRQGACRRIESSENYSLKERLLPGLTSGDLFATVGISHLTTSRRHLGKPALAARRADGGFVLNGYSAWVTGAPHADYVVLGAQLMENDSAAAEQLLAVVPASLPGASAAQPERLVGLSASHTGKFQLDNVFIGEEWLVEGPVENVMTRGAGASTGGLQTSTVALGLSQGAIEFLAGEAARRPELGSPLDALREDLDQVKANLFAAVRGQARCTNDDIRQQANNLALRSTQAALAAAKGSGYVAGHPAGRWCREALFFLVWSCPQPVVAAHLCELAGILD
jgi:alkylation response protein AidB-like acyl-CoA dehydrogenase